jgi:hypothetical protein
MGGCISSPAVPGVEVSNRDRRLHRQVKKTPKDAKAKMAAQVKVHLSIHLLHVYLMLRLADARSPRSSSAPVTRAKAPSSSRCASSTARPSCCRRRSASASSESVCDIPARSAVPGWDRCVSIPCFFFAVVVEYHTRFRVDRTSHLCLWVQPPPYSLFHTASAHSLII